MSFDFLDKNFFKDNWDEFVHQKIFEQVTTINSQSASTANSIASQAESHALSAGSLASQAESHALSAGDLASQAESHALSAGDLASQAESHALSAGVVASTANSIASQAERHALSVVSTASLANSYASVAVSMASQATSVTNNNTNQINKQTQQILNNANNIKELSSNADITNSLASEANSNVAALSQATNGWQTSANSLMHANSAAASQANSTANNNAALINKNTQAILTNKNNLNDLMNTTGYSNPVDFNKFNKVANYLANFWGAKSWANAPKNLPTAGWGTILVRAFNGYGVLQQWIIANDTMQAWNRYQNPNSRAWTMWHYYDFNNNNNVNIQNFNDNRLLNGATGTISAQLTGNVVTLNLQAQHEASNAVIYQLPAALRPKTNTQSAAVEFNNSTIYIDYATISTNGNLQIEQRKYDNTLLDNINVNTIFTYNLQ